VKSTVSKFWLNIILNVIDTVKAANWDKQAEQVGVIAISVTEDLN